MSTAELPLHFSAAAHASPPSPAPHGPAAAPAHRAASPRRLPGVSRSALRAWLIDVIFAPVFRPRTTAEPPWQWGDATGLPVEGGGKYLSRKKPHCRRFIGATTDPRIREQHIMKASRSGYTQGALVRVVHKMSHDAGNVQLTVGSLEKSRDTNVTRLMPMLAALGLIGNPEDDPDDANSKRIRIAGHSIRVVGAFTASAYKADMVELCVNDECETVDYIPELPGSPADGARSRIRGREGAQLLSISKPHEWATHHHRDVATGTLEFLAVPCIHCGSFQELTLDGRSLVDQLRIEEPLRPGARPLNPPLAHQTPRLGRLRFDSCKLLDGSWDFERILTDTYYECVSGCRIDQDTPLTAADLANPLAGPSLSAEVHRLHAEGLRLTHKQAMIISARHLAANPHPIPADGGGPRSKRSEHNTDLVSLDFDMTWGHLAKKFVERAHDPANLRNFLSEHCALPNKIAANDSHLTSEHLAECRAAYERATLPFEPDVLVAGVDSQLGVRKWVIAAARIDSSLKAWRDIAVIDFGYAALRADAIALLDRAFPLAPLAAANALGPIDLSTTHRADHGLVDAGGVEGNTPDVYELSFESRGRLLPSFGRGSESAKLRACWWSEIPKPWRGVNLTIAFYHDDHWKRYIQHGCIRQIREIKTLADIRAPGPADPTSDTASRLAPLDPSAKSYPPRLWLPGLPADGARAEFEAELLAEQLDDKGKWKVTGKNDFADALKTCFVALDFRLPYVVIEKQRAKTPSS